MYPLPPVAAKTVTIANGADTSSAADLEHFTVIGIRWPASFTGATVTFLASDTGGGTYVELVDSSGTAVSVTVAAGKVTGYIPDLAGIRFVKVKSASAEAAERSVVFICKA